MLEEATGAPTCRPLGCSDLDGFPDAEALACHLGLELLSRSHPTDSSSRQYSSISADEAVLGGWNISENARARFWRLATSSVIPDICASAWKLVREFGAGRAQQRRPTSKPKFSSMRVVTRNQFARRVLPKERVQSRPTYPTEAAAAFFGRLRGSLCACYAQSLCGAHIAKARILHLLNVGPEPGSRPSRARCECSWVYWEGFDPSDSA